MSDIQKIQITKIGRKQNPSKFKEGETYTITTIVDGISGKKMSTFGNWADNWKVGDTVEGIIESKTWKDKDGFDQQSWNIKNPNKKEFVPYKKSASATKPLIVEAFHIAAVLAPILYDSKKKLKLVDITELANAIKAELEKGSKTKDNDSTETTPTKKDEGDDVETLEEETDVIEEDVDEEDDKPF